MMEGLKVEGLGSNMMEAKLEAAQRRKKVWRTEVWYTNPRRSPSGTATWFGFRVENLGFGVRSLGFRVRSLEFKI